MTLPIALKEGGGGGGGWLTTTATAPSRFTATSPRRRQLPSLAAATPARPPVPCPGRVVPRGGGALRRAGRQPRGLRRASRVSTGDCRGLSTPGASSAPRRAGLAVKTLLCWANGGPKPTRRPETRALAPTSRSAHDPPHPRAPPFRRRSTGSHGRPTPMIAQSCFGARASSVLARLGVWVPPSTPSTRVPPHPPPPWAAAWADRRPILAPNFSHAATARQPCGRVVHQRRRRVTAKPRRLQLLPARPHWQGGKDHEVGAHGQSAQ